MREVINSLSSSSTKNPDNLPLPVIIHSKSHQLLIPVGMYLCFKTYPLTPIKLSVTILNQPNSFILLKKKNPMLLPEPSSLYSSYTLRPLQLQFYNTFSWIFFCLIKTFARLKHVIYYGLNCLNVSTTFSETSILFLVKAIPFFIPILLKWLLCFTSFIQHIAKEH